MSTNKIKIFPSNKILLLLTVAGFVIFILINQLIFAALSATYTTYGILDFEFAWTKARVLTIFTVWGQQGMLDQRIGVYWDFLYIVGYVSFISGCILLVTRQLEGKVEGIGYRVSVLPALAGVFDIIENINLLIMINNPITFPISLPSIASICALIKFALLGVSIVFFVIAIIILIYRKLKNK